MASPMPVVLPVTRMVFPLSCMVKCDCGLGATAKEAAIVASTRGKRRSCVLDADACSINGSSATSWRAERLRCVPVGRLVSVRDAVCPRHVLRLQDRLYDFAGVHFFECVCHCSSGQAPPVMRRHVELPVAINRITRSQVDQL